MSKRQTIEVLYPGICFFGQQEYHASYVWNTHTTYHNCTLDETVGVYVITTISEIGPCTVEVGNRRTRTSP